MTKTRMHRRRSIRKSRQHVTRRKKYTGGFNPTLESFYKFSNMILKSAILAYDSGIWVTYDQTIEAYRQYANELMGQLRVSNGYHRSVILDLVTNKFTKIMNILDRELKNLEWRNDVALESGITDSELEEYERIH